MDKIVLLLLLLLLLPYDKFLLFETHIDIFRWKTVRIEYQ